MIYNSAVSHRGLTAGYIMAIEANRAPFQVLVFPYRYAADKAPEYAIFERSDTGFWQAIAGGGKVGETVLEAAKRETFEEAGIPLESEYLSLDSMATIPVIWICGYLYWGEDVLVVPEHCFGVLVQDHEIALSKEHINFRWVSYDEARDLLKWDSNRNALWELDWRLREEPSTAMV